MEDVETVLSNLLTGVLLLCFLYFLPAHGKCSVILQGMQLTGDGLRFSWPSRTCQVQSVVMKFNLYLSRYLVLRDRVHLTIPRLSVVILVMTAVLLACNDLSVLPLYLYFIHL
jgi:hypothetical protein